MNNRKYKYTLDLQLFAVEEGANAEEIAELPGHDHEDPDGVEWESFDSDKTETSEEKPEVADPDQKEEPAPRDLEKDRAFAEMRRKAEEAERKLKAADDWVKQQYGSQGINTWEEYEAALKEQQKRESYADKGLDYDEVKKAVREEIQDHPDVVKARQSAQDAAIKAEIAELKLAHPDVKFDAVDDILSLPNSEEIINRVNRGYSLKDAYELANQQEIMQKRIAAAEQAARNRARSKDHLKPSGSASPDEAIAVPDDVMRNYERIFAKQLKSGLMSREDFVKHYKNSLKS